MRFQERLKPVDVSNQAYTRKRRFRVLAHGQRDSSAHATRLLLLWDTEPLQDRADGLRHGGGGSIRHHMAALRYLRKWLKSWLLALVDLPSAVRDSTTSSHSPVKPVFDVLLGRD